MKLQDLKTRVETSTPFKDWQSTHKKSYLSSYFSMNATTWQLDYYDTTTDTITSFVAGKTVQLHEQDSKIFRKEQHAPSQLVITDALAQPPEIIHLIDELVHDKYQGQYPNKKILILHATPMETLWNVTYLTTTFNIIHVKVHAETKKILHDSIESALSYKTNKN